MDGQDIGRCSRDGRQGKAFLYATKASLRHRHTQDDMKYFCNSTQMTKICRRGLILKHLLTKTMDPMYTEYHRAVPALIKQSIIAGWNPTENLHVGNVPRFVSKKFDNKWNANPYEVQCITTNVQKT